MPTPIVSSATTHWNGDLFSGSGNTTFDTSGIGTFSVNWKARAIEAGAATSPEELIAAAHATCFSMQFSNELAESGTPPDSLHVTAAVTFVAGQGITGIALRGEGEVLGITPEQYETLAQSAKNNCPVSRALAAVPITIESPLKA